MQSIWPAFWIWQRVTTSDGIIHYKVTQLSGPSVLAISWAGKNRKFFRAPNAIHRSVMLRRWSDVTSRTTTPVWTVRMSILSPSIFQVEYLGFFHAWLHGDRSCISRSTSTWYVLTNCLSVAVVAALVAKHGKTISCCCQCRGTPDLRHSFGWLYFPCSLLFSMWDFLFAAHWSVMLLNCNWQVVPFGFGQPEHCLNVHII